MNSNVSEMHEDVQNKHGEPKDYQTLNPYFSQGFTIKIMLKNLVLDDSLYRLMKLGLDWLGFFNQLQSSAEKYLHNILRKNRNNLHRKFPKKSQSILFSNQSNLHLFLTKSLIGMCL